MGYEESIQCQVLATACACCSKPLVDSVSIETGMGPVCRSKHGYNLEVPEETRREANQLVYLIAVQQTGDEVLFAILRLSELGFSKLADRIAKRIGSVQVEETTDGMLAVKAPYNEQALTGWRRIPGRRWDGQEKVNKVPITSKSALWGFLREYYPKHIGQGSKGFFLIQ